MIRYGTSWRLVSKVSDILKAKSAHGCRNGIIFRNIDYFYKDVKDLSGGQKQLLNLAAVMTLQPSVLILDEPTSRLDPIAAYEFCQTLARINREFGTTIIISEHRFEEVLPISDRVVVMDKGRIVAIDTPDKIGYDLLKENNPMFDAMPPNFKVFYSINDDNEQRAARYGQRCARMAFGRNAKAEYESGFNK